MKGGTIREILEESCRAYRDIPAVKYLSHRQVQVKTYGLLWEDVLKTAHLIQSQGLAGTHIALAGTSSYPWICTYFAILFSGSTAVPLDAGLPPEELHTLMNRADAAALFFDSSRKDVLEGLSQACPSLHGLFSMDEGTEEEGVLSLQRALEDVSLPEGFSLPPSDPQAMCTLMYTSGTTGVSKGVMLSQRNLAENVSGVYIDVEPGAVMLSVLPIHHAFCLTMEWMKGLSVGATICINDSLLHMLKNMKRFQPRAMLMVPLMVETIYKKLRDVSPLLPKKLVAKEAFGGSLEYIFCGGARLDPVYIREFEKYGIEIFQGYGMTECSPVISASGQLANRIGAVGKPLPGCQIRFVEEEIQVKSPSVMAGYYKMPQETARAFQDGWLCTGDLGRMDEDGFLYITGRKKNLIILSNGENISPEELEGKLALESLISEIIVTGDGSYLTAHIYPDYEFAAKKHWDEEKVGRQLQKILDRYNQTQPTYKRLIGLDIRKEPFEKSSTRKIKRNLV